MIIEWVQHFVFPDRKRHWLAPLKCIASPFWCPAERPGPSPCRASWWSWCLGRDAGWSPGCSSAPRWDTPEGGTHTAACGWDTRTQTHMASHLLACSYTLGSQRCLRCRPEPYQRVCWPWRRRKMRHHETSITEENVEMEIIHLDHHFRNHMLCTTF